jgi:hypothetical protein
MGHPDFASKRRIVDGLANVIIGSRNASVIDHLWRKLVARQQYDPISAIQIAKATKPIAQGHDQGTHIFTANRLVNDREIRLKTPKCLFKPLTRRNFHAPKAQPTTNTRRNTPREMR